MTKDPLSDSAGVPWSGRHFEENPWIGDDGSAPIELSEALGRLLHSEPVLGELLSALRGGRLLVPLVANVGEQGMGAHGQIVDKSADLAIVAVATPDGASAIPVFSSVTALESWNAVARPVPVAAERIAVAAVAEGHNRIVIDPAGPAIGVRRPMLAALATGSDWLSPELNPDVRLVIDECVAGIEAVVSYELISGDPTGKLLEPELLIELQILPGLSRESLDDLLTSVAQQITTPEFQRVVDSFGFRVVSAPVR